MLIHWALNKWLYKSMNRKWKIGKSKLSKEWLGVNLNMLNVDITLKSLNVLFIDDFAGFLDHAWMWHLIKRSVCRKLLGSIQDSNVRLDKILIQMLTYRNRCVFASDQNQQYRISNVIWLIWKMRIETIYIYKETKIKTSKPRRMTCFFFSSLWFWFSLQTLEQSTFILLFQYEIVVDCGDTFQTALLSEFHFWFSFCIVHSWIWIFFFVWCQHGVASRWMNETQCYTNKINTMIVLQCAESVGSWKLRTCGTEIHFHFVY